MRTKTADLRVIEFSFKLLNHFEFFNKMKTQLLGTIASGFDVNRFPNNALAPKVDPNCPDIELAEVCENKCVEDLFKCVADCGSDVFCCQFLTAKKKFDSKTKI